MKKMAKWKSKKVSNDLDCPLDKDILDAGYSILVKSGIENLESRIEI